MEDNRFLQDSWTNICLDTNFIVTEVRNPDNVLFFGKCPEKETEFTGCFPTTGRNQSQATLIKEEIERAINEKRTVF